eukprot:gene20519-biopygen11602
MHILRLLPPHITEHFAEDIDRRVLQAFTAINHVEDAFDATSKQLCETPLSYGGLGMRPLKDHRAAAFVGAWLHTMAHVRKEHASIIPEFEQGWEGPAKCAFHTDYQNAVDLLDSQLGEQRAAQSILQLSIPDILAQERPQLQKQLSRA